MMTLMAAIVDADDSEAMEPVSAAARRSVLLLVYVEEHVDYSTIPRRCRATSTRRAR